MSEIRNIQLRFEELHTFAGEETEKSDRILDLLRTIRFSTLPLQTACMFYNKVIDYIHSTSNLTSIRRVMLRGVALTLIRKSGVVSQN